MKKKPLILSIASIAVVGTVLCSCGKSDVPTYSATNNSEIEVSEQMNSTDDQNQAVDSLSWIQLGNLTSHPELRKSIEEALNITTDSNGNKDGMIYINPKTLEQDNNSTLFSAMHNINFVDAITSTVGDTAITKHNIMNMGATEYTDIDTLEGLRETSDEALAAAINAYFELLPDAEANTFNGSITLTRAQAMTLFMRAITPVNESNNPTANTSFISAVGSNIYTDYASYVDKYAYLNTSNGLDTTSFDGAMTIGEYICMLTNFIDEDYRTYAKENGYSENLYSDTAKETTLTLANAGNISLSEAIASADAGCPSDMYETFQLAVTMELLPEAYTELWDEVLTKTSATSLFIDMMRSYIYRDKTEQKVYASDSVAAQEDNSVWAGNEHHKQWEDYNKSVYEATGMSTIQYQQYAQSQGADLTAGWCWIYEHGKGAGDNPTYAINMQEGSPDYGKRYEVGDYLPDGTQLYGTNEELQQVDAENGAKAFEEAGYEVTRNDDGTYHVDFTTH